MIRFIIKGIVRDRSRSLLPVVVISIGVFLTVALSGYMKGAFRDIIDQNAKFETGHVRVMTQAYAENKDQIPNDLALLGVEELLSNLRDEYDEMEWVSRIRFGGLIDVPDANGNTKAQGPTSGMALQLLNPDSREIQRMNIEESMISGRIPNKLGEAILGHAFAEKLGLSLGDTFTYFGTTMEGSMSFHSFKLVGTLSYGLPVLDKGAAIIDIGDAQRMLDMEDGAGEILGFSKEGIYKHKQAQDITDDFNERFMDTTDQFAPVMLPLKAQNNLGSYLDYAEVMSGMFVFLFVLAMSIVLWNTGLLGGLRRYKEFGIRLALGESKGQIYRALILEAIIVGIMGSILGTLLGLGLTWYMQVYGIDIAKYLEQSSMIMPTVIRSEMTAQLYYIGFIPGVLAMVFGTMLAGIGIYKRETAQLSKELEV